MKTKHFFIFLVIIMLGELSVQAQQRTIFFQLTYFHRPVKVDDIEFISPRVSEYTISDNGFYSITVKSIENLYFDFIVIYNDRIFRVKEAYNPEINNVFELGERRELKFFVKDDQGYPIKSDVTVKINDKPMAFADGQFRVELPEEEEDLSLLIEKEGYETLQKSFKSYKDLFNHPYFKLNRKYINLSVVDDKNPDHPLYDYDFEIWMNNKNIFKKEISKPEDTKIYLPDICKDYPRACNSFLIIKIKKKFYKPAVEEITFDFNTVNKEVHKKIEREQVQITFTTRKKYNHIRVFMLNEYADFTEKNQIRKMDGRSFVLSLPKSGSLINLNIFLGRSKKAEISFIPEQDTNINLTSYIVRTKRYKVHFSGSDSMWQRCNIIDLISKKSVWNFSKKNRDLKLREGPYKIVAEDDLHFKWNSNKLINNRLYIQGGGYLEVFQKDSVELRVSSIDNEIYYIEYNKDGKKKKENLPTKIKVTKKDIDSVLKSMKLINNITGTEENFYYKKEYKIATNIGYIISVKLAPKKSPKFKEAYMAINTGQEAYMHPIPINDIEVSQGGNSFKIYKYQGDKIYSRVPLSVVFWDTQKHNYRATLTLFQEMLYGENQILKKLKQKESYSPNNLAAIQSIILKKAKYYTSYFPVKALIFLSNYYYLKYFQTKDNKYIDTALILLRFIRVAQSETIISYDRYQSSISRYIDNLLDIYKNPYPIYVNLDTTPDYYINKFNPWTKNSLSELDMKRLKKILDNVPDTQIWSYDILKVIYVFQKTLEANNPNWERLNKLLDETYTKYPSNTAILFYKIVANQLMSIKKPMPLKQIEDYIRRKFNGKVSRVTVSRVGINLVIFIEFNKTYGLTEYGLTKDMQKDFSNFLKVINGILATGNPYMRVKKNILGMADGYKIKPWGIPLKGEAKKLEGQIFESYYYHVSNPELSRYDFLFYDLPGKPVSISLGDRIYINEKLALLRAMMLKNQLKIDDSYNIVTITTSMKGRKYRKAGLVITIENYYILEDSKTFELNYIQAK